MIRAIAAERAAPEPPAIEEATDTIEVTTRPIARAAENEAEPLTDSATVTTPDIGLEPTAAPTKPGRQNQIMIGMGIGIVLAIGLGLVALVTRSREAPAPPSVALPTDSLAPSLTPSPSPAPERPLANQIRVVADRPIAKLKIGNRLVAIAPPERDVTVRLTDQELARNERVEATSDDGKKMSLELDGTADTIDIDFSSAEQKPRRIVGFAGPKPPPPAPTGSTRAPLAPNPYGKK
jgi:hypothetical protein